jgi:nucleotide-binding universal stress UspA family protein
MEILVCYDGSEASKNALLLAKTHAKTRDGQIHILTLLSTGHELHLSDMNKADEELDEWKTKIESEGLNCKAKLITDDRSPGEMIVDYAADKDINEIFVGVKKRSKVSKILLGSTAQYVILEAECPVVSVK